MSDDLVKECLAARDEPRPHRPPSETKRLSLTEAYAAQDRLRDALLGRGERVAGWKAGFTSKAGQESFARESIKKRIALCERELAKPVIQA